MQALERAEGVSGAKHPRIIPTLIHLGEVYAHTQRVTLAEGLYRHAVGFLNSYQQILPICGKCKQNWHSICYLMG